MRTVSVFKNGANQAIHLPKDMQFQGLQELEISKQGDVITLRPIRPSWLSFVAFEPADVDFLQDRADVMTDRV